MLTDRVMSIAVGRTGFAMIADVLRAIPGLEIIDDGPHQSYGVMEAKCITRGIPVPPAMAFVRNPWEWQISHWCWVNQHGPCFRGTFPEYIAKVQADPTNFNFRSLAHSWALHGADNAQYIGRYENLYDDVVRFLLEVIPDLTTEVQIRASIAASKWPGQGVFTDGRTHGDYRQYYDDETRRIVAELESTLIGRFGYEF